ncbi:MAG: hypothetical protein DI549_00630 [Ancylobacter novellus]|uniref:WYL domain-containing protein n=1 Tax=Ancylobacter novellus TaxID=921 RepID=A0A2W5R7H1_ANCNO|nr:MAG: hypothetical protein DI549_00630 [Ancylobacter novellus]
MTGFGQTGEVKLLYFTYRNWRGEVSERSVVPLYVWHGATEWHPEAQWLLHAFDASKRQDRDFAMADMSNLRHEREAP